MDCEIKCSFYYWICRGCLGLIKVRVHFTLISDLPSFLFVGSFPCYGRRFGGLVESRAPGERQIRESSTDSLVEFHQKRRCYSVNYV